MCMGTLFLRRALRHNLGNYRPKGGILPFVNRAFEWSGHRNIFVCFEYCASPLSPFDPLPAPEIEDHQCCANYPTANCPYPVASRKHSLWLALPSFPAGAQPVSVESKQQQPSPLETRIVCQRQEETGDIHWQYCAC